MKLTDSKLKSLKPSGKVQKLPDGDGLYTHVSPVGGKLWRLFSRFNGKRKTLALGKYPEAGPAEARIRPEKARGLAAQGVAPSAYKREIKATTAADAADMAHTFEAVARAGSAKIHGLNGRPPEEYSFRSGEPAFPVYRRVFHFSALKLPTA
ncbi:Arm DNA-binding domain-containing protein [uncultured Bilophila sp.]|uniref:Arm DNA-binding domain-containing protein n=1 Tax=uncultured Bilophila sp. TaxID=529385 RepID=UPI0025F266E2|nr:Arm DNA-binding domain-containing protein [uncultured Bilophila sp.]